jgi:hypothetical protein
MQRKIKNYLYLMIPGLLIYLLVSTFSVSARGLQQGTPQPPTVTSTPQGPIVTVRSDQEAYINVRSGPGIFYEKIGVLLQGQQVPAKGRSVGGDWILVDYPGVPGGVAWVYAPFVDLTPGSLPIVEPPPTPTPLFTATIDPTLAAQFIVTLVPTGLPTYTPPAPLTIPTYVNQTQAGLPGIPIGLLIIILLGSGLFIGLYSISRNR